MLSEHAVIKQPTGILEYVLPLQNPMPVVPPMPIPPRRRGRGGRAVLGPLHNISSRQNDPALNGLHRGHISIL